tara:strand:+ start:1417 stop:2397 length:981 start_codon:yes stop_codon:yes gene_type:complete
MNLIIHVGQPKTGTTSIQNILKINSKKIQELGFLYETNSLNHQPMVQDILASENVDAALHNFVSYQKDLARQRDCKSIILSSEAFFEFDSEFIRKMLKEFDCNTRIVAYLKRQDLYLESIWKQWHFKNKHYANFSEFVEKFKFLDYLVTLENWEKLVGAENITVVPFEKREMKNGLLSGFMEILGVPKDKISELDFNVPKNMFGTNQGLSPKGLKFASLVSEFANGPLDYTIENFIHEYLSDVFHKNYFEGYGLFDLDARKQYLSAFSNSNKELANKFLCRDSLFLDEIKEEKIDVNLNFEDIARVVMSMGMKFDKKLKDMKCDKS